VNGGLTIENLGRVIESGDAGEFLGGGLRAEKRAESEARSAGVGSVPGAGTTFADMLQESLETVNRHQLDANAAIESLVAGRTRNIHETMLAVERADTSLKLMMQVRNKILEAYREIMRMQV